jgi:uncharacterized membrane protein
VSRCYPLQAPRRHPADLDIVPCNLAPVMVRKLAGPLFILTGVLHFLIPRTYEAIMPPYLPAHRPLVYASGIAEVAGGAALLSSSPRARELGKWWLYAVLLAVFPANVHMALNPGDFKRVPGTPWSLYARLPLQLVFAAWVRAAARPTT